MVHTVKAVISEQGEVRLLEPVQLPQARQALVTILDEAAVSTPSPAPGPGDEGWRALYHPVRRLGRGGMGETYLAVDRATGKFVCVKVLLPDVDPRSLQQECRALAKLQHPHIVSLLNFDTRQDQPYLVVQFVEGPTLADYLRQQPALVESVAANLGERLFDALAYAHDREVLHCDLKPGNVLLEHNGSELLPRIVDFGLAVVDRRDHRDVLTAVGRLAGTPAYMPPEQLQGAKLSGACDVYATGQILWESVMGQSAFSGAPTAVMGQKVSQREGLRVVNPPWEVSPTLAGVIEACTHPDPARRPAAREALGVLRTVEPKVEAPAVVTATNLGFEWPATEGTPPGWFNSLGFVDGVSGNYAYTLVPRGDGTAGTCVRWFGEPAARKEFGSLMQRIPGRCLRDKELRLEGEIRTEQVADWAGLWLRVDGADRTLFFDNMHDRPIRGWTPWATHTISVRLPRETVWINYGVVLVGEGAVFIDNIRILVQNAERSWVPLCLWREDGQPLGTIPTT